MINEFRWRAVLAPRYLGIFDFSVPLHVDPSTSLRRLPVRPSPEFIRIFTASLAILFLFFSVHSNTILTWSIFIYTHIHTYNWILKLLGMCAPPHYRRHVRPSPGNNTNDDKYCDTLVHAFPAIEKKKKWRATHMSTRPFGNNIILYSLIPHGSHLHPPSLALPLSPFSVEQRKYCVPSRLYALFLWTSSQRTMRWLRYDEKKYHLEWKKTTTYSELFFSVHVPGCSEGTFPACSHFDFGAFSTEFDRLVMNGQNEIKKKPNKLLPILKKK